MANPISYRRRQISLIPKSIGAYVLCDLDEVPIYVGISRDGIRNRVRRHLTSARSDVIANRLIDVWEIAFVWSWPVADKAQLKPLEAFLFHRYNDQKALMNGTLPKRIESLPFPEPEMHRVQIMEDAEIQLRRTPVMRLPRQAEHFGQLLSHILNVKDNKQLRRSLMAHFERLTVYHKTFLDVSGAPEDAEEDGEEA